MKKILIILVFFLTTQISSANELLSNLSGKVSEYAAAFIPGEGVTEVSIELKESEEPDFSILAVRDISKTNDTNFFTQFSVQNNDVGGEERYIGNVGLGYRVLSNDESMLFGVNSFFDRDLVKGNARGSIGFEVKAYVLDVNINQYLSLSNMKDHGQEEQSLGGGDYTITSQIPYTPWATFSLTGYRHDSDKAARDTKGEVYTLGMALTPTLNLDVSRDESNHASGDVDSLNLYFIYPPQEHKPTLLDGMQSEDIWYKKESMKHKLSQKVKRNNNIVVEVQGSVIITSK